ncbi:MAG: TetR/AcrR family transcriptional regulator [Bacteroidota bacterium]
MKKDHTTEEKIKEVARNMFIQKGYASTTTRDIATEAGTNLALVNYYFRSKEKLFNLIMRESLMEFFATVKHILNDPNTQLDQKVSRLSEHYINQLGENPDIPLFILSEIRSNPQIFLNDFFQGVLLKDMIVFRQLREHLKDIDSRLHPVHLLMNLMGMILFPFIVKPIISQVTHLKDDEFDTLMEERKELIPMWFNHMIS